MGMRRIDPDELGIPAAIIAEDLMDLALEEIEMGNWKAATEFLKIAEELNPENEDIQRQMAFVEAMRKR